MQWATPHTVQWVTSVVGDIGAGEGAKRELPGGEVETEATVGGVV